MSFTIQKVDGKIYMATFRGGMELIIADSTQQAIKKFYRSQNAKKN
jgi:hypothetical protein